MKVLSFFGAVLSPIFIFTACTQFRSLNSSGTSLVSATGQVLGTLETGELVCVHKFIAGQFEISSPEGSQCGANRRSVERSQVSIASDAYRPWLQEIPPGGMIKLEMRYATSQIFPKGDGNYRITNPLYGQARCFLHPEVAAAINRAEKLLRTKRSDLRLLVLDCYRPIYVSALMWALVPDPQFVGPPGKSFHNKGAAVDLTLAKMEGTTPVPLDMGSEFDLFDAAKSAYPGDVNSAQRSNRKILRDVMTAPEVGFNAYDAEWWHFSMSGITQALDLPL